VCPECVGCVACSGSYFSDERALTLFFSFDPQMWSKFQEQKEQATQKPTMEAL
jgi:hypothetical protein